jgi:hypothetical protein
MIGLTLYTLIGIAFVGLFCRAPASADASDNRLRQLANREG